MPNDRARVPDVFEPQSGSQALFVACPIYEAIYEGTRGPGKTTGLLMDYGQHVGEGFGPHWRGILFRRTYKQLDDVVAKSKLFFRSVFRGARFNESDYVWRFRDGEELLLRYMDNVDDYWNYHGHEYPWIAFEELTNWPDLGCYQAMKACSRSSHPGMPRKYRATCNPYGVGHNAVKLYIIDPAPPGVPIVNAEGLQRVRLFGHYSENKRLLAADPDYEKRLLSDPDPNRRRAWAHGDWDIVAGGMFDDVFDRSVHIITTPFEIPKSWRIDRSFDWGSARPFSVGWWAESDGTEATMPDGTRRVWPRETLFRIGEWYGWDGVTPNVGIKLEAEKIAAGVLTREMALGIRGRVEPGPADRSIFDAEPGRKSIADVMRAVGVLFTEADKRPGSRKTGWELMRGRFLAGRETPMERPGLFVFESCRQFIRTVPTLPRDTSNPEDIDTDAEDHIADETRYRILAPRVAYGTSRFRI